MRKGRLQAPCDYCVTYTSPSSLYCNPPPYGWHVLPSLVVPGSAIISEEPCLSVITGVAQAAQALQKRRNSNAV